MLTLLLNVHCAVAFTLRADEQTLTINKAKTPFPRKIVCRFNMSALLSAQFAALGYASANTSHSAMQKSGRRSLSYRCKAYRADTMDPWMTSSAASRSAT